MVQAEELADLTADDMQLLLSGAGGFIKLETFHEVTKFRDQRGPEMRASDPERLNSFKELVRRQLDLASSSGGLPPCTQLTMDLNLHR